MMGIDRLEAANAAMLQRWATIHNLFQAEGDLKIDAILAVAKLSAEEFVVNGAEFGGDRLIRQESAARALLLAKRHLDVYPIMRGTPMHAKISRAAAQLSSYPDRNILSTETGDKPVDG